MKCVNIQCENKEYQNGLCRRHYSELTGKATGATRMILKRGDSCARGHIIDGDNVSSYERNGKEYVTCLKCRKENASNSMERNKIGDDCVNGHKLVGENAEYYTRSSGNQAIRCRKCRILKNRERQRKFRQTDEYKEYLAKRRAEAEAKQSRSDAVAVKADKVLVEEVKQGKASYAGLNYLKLGKRAQKAWEPLAEKFDNEIGFCKDNPGPYIDYDEETPPSKQMAFKMCEGCPLLVECARFAAAYKPVIGVWGGEVYENGKVMLG